MNSRMHLVQHKWNKWRLLPWPEQRTFLVSLCLLPLAGLLLRLGRYQTIYATLQKITRLGEEMPREEALQTARRSASLVSAASRYGPYDATCLRRSLVLWWLLRRSGIDSQLRLGVSKDMAVFSGHAWVEYHGHVVNDHQNIAEKFLPML